MNFYPAQTAANLAEMNGYPGKMTANPGKMTANPAETVANLGKTVANLTESAAYPAKMVGYPGKKAAYPAKSQPPDELKLSDRGWRGKTKPTRETPMASLCSLERVVRS